MAALALKTTPRSSTFCGRHRAAGSPVLRVGARPQSTFLRSPQTKPKPAATQLVVRAAAEPAKDLKDLKDLEKIQARVEDASKSLQDAATKLDLSQLVRFNFFAQLILAASSWGIMFFTSHATMAAGAKIGPGTIILMAGTVLSGYSAFLSYRYFSEVSSAGASVLDGWGRLSKFFSHMTFNFLGAAAAVMSLQATVGSQVLGTVTRSAMDAVHLSSGSAGGASPLALQFLMQAAANTLMAHIVSIFFLVLLVKKTTDAYQPMITMAEKFKEAMAMP